MGKHHEALADLFGFSTFRPHQEGIVEAILAGRDVFAVMPTGGGKSLCYQLPAHLLNGVCVVVSPLISLMKDQVDAARANGLRAGSLNSAVDADERTAVGAALRAGEIDLLYVSPERFNTPSFLERLTTLNLAFFAIDEAHCISEWGHDFRPDYLQLGQITTVFPGVPVVALTATATHRVADDIVERLHLRDPYRVRASFDRPNLFYRIVPKEQPDRQLLDFLRERPGESGIVYRTTRKNVESTAAMLREAGFTARAYHAGMPDDERAAVQEAFRRDECPIIVATIAFGMGIDKSNVRFVVHADLPKNMEGYYQETGRAGRDGDPAECLLLFGGQDFVQQSHFAERTEDPHAREVAKAQLQQMRHFAEHDGCRRIGLLEYFGETYPKDNCDGCDICRGDVQREDATIAAQKALSAMVRTQCRFGATHITDILVGADTERIRQYGHDRLPTYGVGRDMKKSYWRRVIDAMLTQGLVCIDDAQFPKPTVTEAGWQVLRGERSFEMLRQSAASRNAKKGKKAAAPSPGSDESPFSELLFERLRAVRTELARTENVPPYIIFSDRTLHDMVKRHPRNPDELLEVVGIGRHKLEKYGDAFLDVLCGG